MVDGYPGWLTVSMGVCVFPGRHTGSVCALCHFDLSIDATTYCAGTLITSNIFHVTPRGLTARWQKELDTHGDKVAWRCQLGLCG